MKVLLLFAVLCLVAAAGARPLSRDSFIEAEARFRLDTKTGFATPEHETLGSEGLAEAKKAEPKAAAGDAIKLNDKVTMSFGELVALAGDFMGPTTTKDVLCLKASKEAVKSTVDGWAKAFSKAQYDNLKNVKNREADLVAAAVKTGKPAEDAVGGKIGEGLTQDYIHASKGMKPAKHSFIGYLQDTLSKSPYVQMAKVNYDHFFHRDCSRKAYHYCHELAHDAAKKGDLNQAMIYEGFANHYLTDRFAPGHIRTPRQGLSLCNGKVALGDALSKCQHDEDNKTGLTVKNSKGESWLAYGDGRLPNANNAANKKRAIDAVAASIQELFKADLPKEGEGAEALAPVSVDATANKHKPLFKEEAGALMYRTAVDLAKVPAAGEVKYDKVTGDLCVVILLDCWEFNKGVAKFMDNLSWTYMMARHKIIQAGKGLKKVGEKIGQGAKAVGNAVKNGAKSIASGVKNLLPKKKKKKMLL